MNMKTKTPSESIMQSSRNAVRDLVTVANCKTEDFNIEALAAILADLRIREASNVWATMYEAMEQHRI